MVASTHVGQCSLKYYIKYTSCAVKTDEYASLREPGLAKKA